MTAPADGATTPPADQQPADQQPADQKEYTPPATQAELDRLIADRVARTKAQFKDYGDLKSKATEYDQLVEASKSDLEKANEQASRWQTEAQTWRRSAVGSRIEALAAADFADPSDAVTALADKDYLDAGGQIDTEAIRRDLAEVLERKPHWRRPEAQPTGPRIPAPNPAQGSSGRPAATEPAQEFAAILQGQLRS